jgi:hypothetical protein
MAETSSVDRCGGQGLGEAVSRMLGVLVAVNESRSASQGLNDFSLLA